MMVWYVAIVAILNFGLGYGLAVLLGAGRKQVALATADASGDMEPDEFEN